MYDPITERGRQLQEEYLDRKARERPYRIPPITPILGPDWLSYKDQMIERVKLLKATLLRNRADSI